MKAQLETRKHVYVLGTYAQKRSVSPCSHQFKGEVSINFGEDVDPLTRPQLGLAAVWDASEG